MKVLTIPLQDPRENTCKKQNQQVTLFYFYFASVVAYFGVSEEQSLLQQRVDIS